MRRIISILLTVFLLAAPLSMFANAAQTTDEIMPRYNNLVSVSTSVTIDSNGKMTISNFYEGQSGITTKAVIKTYIERRVLGLFWTRVDTGTSNNEWVDTIYNFIYSGSHIHQLEKSGTYKVTVTYQIFGTGGPADEIVVEKTETYR